MKDKARCIVFEAPDELKQQIRQYAKKNLTNTSVVCRQVLNQFMQSQELGGMQYDIQQHT